jgi:HSP20 family protein
MAVLARRESGLEDLFDFRRDFDGLISRMVRSGAGGIRPSDLSVAAPPIEALVDTEKKEYRLRVALPGVKPEEIQLSLQGNSLTISGEHKAEEEKKDSSYIHREFSFERFERTIVLPKDIDTDDISAEYNNGVLEIVAPFSAAALPKKIEVKSQAKSKAATTAST